MFKAEQALGPCISSALRLLFRWINRSSYMSLISVSAAVNNMDVSVLCLLTVALSFGLQPSSALSVIPEDKPGVCPMTDILVNPDDRFCRDRCFRIFSVGVVSPPKPGSCPRPNHFVRCHRKCSSDDDCRAISNAAPAAVGTPA
ncbi:hypothetical protein WMY93_030463 [Mugilogobius chulae]|uniref:WAP domain-containing protein n=1 Tax=Mugilogobius chulae TaxID=88201 RepID=A0AAW0MNF5_9GOBI